MIRGYGDRFLCFFFIVGRVVGGYGVITRCKQVCGVRLVVVGVVFSQKVKGAS